MYVILATFEDKPGAVERTSKETINDAKRLKYSCYFYYNFLRNNFAEPVMLNDTTIEERVTVLEFQVAGITDDITQINDDITAINSDVTTLTDDVSTLENDVRDLDEDLESQLTVISAEQVLQDDRIFTLEQNNEGAVLS